MAAPASWLSHERYPPLLLGLLAAVSLALAIHPHDRADWLLEKSLLFAAVGVLIGTRRVLPLEIWLMGPDVLSALVSMSGSGHTR